jgi:hypothetical protein
VGSGISATEGTAFAGAVASFPTSSGYTASISWGDGSSSAGSFSGGQIVGQHTWTGEGSFPVVTTVTNTASGSSVGFTSTATVADAPLSVTALAGSFDVGENFYGVVGSYSDSAAASDPNATFSGTVTWGDGSSSTATLANGQVLAGHTYAAAGTYTMTLTVSEGGGARASGSTNLPIPIPIITGGGGGPGPMPPIAPPIEGSDTTCTTCGAPDIIASPPGVRGGGTDADPYVGDTRSFDGTTKLAINEFPSDGFGTPWGDTITWTNNPGYADDLFNGSGTVDAQFPFLRASGNEIAVITNGVNARFFQGSGGTYTELLYLQESLLDDVAHEQFVLTDSMGDVIRFWDFSAPAGEQGQFDSFTDPGGNRIAVTSRTSDGKPSVVQRTDNTNGVSTVESYAYSYLPPTDVNAGLLSTIVMSRTVNGGPAGTVRAAAFSYYDGSPGAFGNLGDLASIMTSDSAGNVLGTDYFRYYRADTATGYVHGLSAYFDATAVARMSANVPGGRAPTRAYWRHTPPGCTNTTAPTKFLKSRSPATAPR